MKFRIVQFRPDEKPLQQLFPAAWNREQVMRVFDEMEASAPAGSVTQLFEQTEALVREERKTNARTPANR